MDIKEKYTVDDLIAIVRRLREPDGCPWDRVQTHESIKKNMIEETYEAIDALDNGNDHDFANELGDVLLQVVFHAVMADERGAFDFDTVLKEICDKLISRHSHVFGKDKAGNVSEALTNWEKNKKKEKKIPTATGVLRDVPSYLPALMRASKIQKKASGFGFDWADVSGVYDKINEELGELKDAKTPDELNEEYGDLLFSVVNLSRFIGVDAETALAAASNKFISRFERVENAAKANGNELGELDADELDKLWNLAKNP